MKCLYELACNNDRECIIEILDEYVCYFGFCKPCSDYHPRSNCRCGADDVIGYPGTFLCKNSVSICKGITIAEEEP